MLPSPFLSPLKIMLGILTMETLQTIEFNLIYMYCIYIKHARIYIYLAYICSIHVPLMGIDIVYCVIVISRNFSVKLFLSKGTEDRIPI